MSQTKAAKIIDAFHDNDLASSTLKAVIENDYDLFLNALYDANLDIEDVTLSDAELDNFIKGVTPSGELDITTWEGYYEAISADSANLADSIAFLIFSKTRGVYWGSRSEILSDVPGNYKVDYTLTSDGKINFSATNGNSVSITLTRTFDEATDNFDIKFSAAYNGQTISGEKVAPPLQPVSIDRSTGQTLTILDAFSPVEASENVFKTWLDVYNFIASTCSILGYVPVTISHLIRWCRPETPEKREERSLRTRRQFEEGRAVEEMELLTKHRTGSLHVDFSSAARELENMVTSAINNKLNRDTNWNRDVDEIVQELKPLAETTGRDTIERYVKKRINPLIEQNLSPFASMYVYNEVKDRIQEEAIGSRVDTKITELWEKVELGDTPYDPLIRTLTLEARKRKFARDYKKSDADHMALESAYKAARRAKELVQGNLNEVEKEIQRAKEEKDKKTEQELTTQRGELIKELTEKRENEMKRRREWDRAQNETVEAGKRWREAEDRVRRDAGAKERWEKKVEGVFK
ncbi:hypothetical protein Clacol_007939 [Clathrus columnatus]|uniref:Uncharacterized protein n=1 Tax=Clathrus columnatus TaxID=1419009 RepID=A0AAV5AJL7_9AGAM|nr:hypothetical protein Clacol_007939 [Clathrus columnatus]